LIGRGYFRALGAVAIVVARKIGLPDVINVGLAALCIGGGQKVSLTIEPLHRECVVEKELCHATRENPVVEGCYEQAMIAKVSSAIQSAFIG
jgi:hypothetical protein